jgi:hypothetical protein
MAGTKTNRKRVEAAVLTSHTSSQVGTVDMKSAVNAAVAFIKDYFPGAKDILLEEVGLEEGRYVTNEPGSFHYRPTLRKAKYPFWNVVISFKLGEPGTLSEVMGGDPRIYRKVHIDSASGAPSSMEKWG